MVADVGKRAGGGGAVVAVACIDTGYIAVAALTAVGVQVCSADHDYPQLLRHQHHYWMIYNVHTVVPVALAADDAVTVRHYAYGVERVAADAALHL